VNSAQLLDEISHIVAVPGGMNQLHRLVLQLAISGDLLPRHQSTTTASTLIAEIRVLRKALVESKQIRRQIQLPPISASELEFDLPEGWVFERLGNVCEVIRGVTFSSSQQQSVFMKGLVPCLRTTNVQEEIDWNDLIYIDEELVGRSDQWLCPGDTIISMANSYEQVGKVAMVREVIQKATFGGFVAVVRPHLINPDYMYLVLRSPYVQNKMRSTASQTTNIANISLGGIYPIPLPIPPIEDQTRIVAKVNELLDLCKKLASYYKQKEQLGRVLRKTTFDHLVSSKDSKSLAINWQRTAENSALWCTSQTAVEEFRNALCFLGFRGLLTEPSAIFTRGEENTEMLALPPGWSWVTLQDLSKYITSGSRGWSQYLAPQGDVFIRSQDISLDKLVFEDKAFVALPEQAEGKRTLVQPGDLLITITGANVGKCAQVPLLKGDAYVSQHVALVRVRDTRHTPFLHYWITNTFGGRKYLAKYIYGDKPGLNLSQVGSIPIPLPPQDAQDRIVGTQVEEAITVAEALAVAMVSSITGISVQKGEKMKAPKTELVSTLQTGAIPSTKDHAPLSVILARSSGELSAKALWSTSGLEIEAFYQQLKTEMSKGWIIQPEIAYVREIEAN
jgi:type I restriction enzyme, S subunit